MASTFRDVFVNPLTQTRPLCVVTLPCVLLLGGWAGSLSAEEAPAALTGGAAVYQQQCAACHGELGRGTTTHPIPLTGDLSVAALSRYIHATMPEGEPEACIDEEAKQVAEYIHQTFYSPAAQARINPVAVQFSRLTVRQIEQSLSDLLGSFRSQPEWTQERGLQAAYFDNRRIGNWGPKTALISRTDPEINFDFGTERPEGMPQREETKDESGGAKYSPLEYGIRWKGAVLAPETGDYEFIVETCNGVRMWVNHPEDEGSTGYTSAPVPLIDGLVRAGEEVEYRETVRLVGGRVYPLRLDFIRFAEKQGYVRLKWKRPGHTEEVIPQRFLLPQLFPRQFVMTTAFPPDDRSEGYERGTSVSEAWQEAMTHAALETAAETVTHSLRLAEVADDDTPEQRAEKIRLFCEQFVERAFRRPLTAEEKAYFVESRLQGVRTNAGIRRVVLLALLSPRFLYREHGLSEFDDYALASWLSYVVWDSLPDAGLLEAARENRLQTREQLEEQVARMLQDPRAQSKLREFTRQWLQLDRFTEISKDSELYPEFDAQLSSDLRTSLELFLDEVLQSPEASFRQLLVDEGWYVNRRLATFYGLELPEEAAASGFFKVTESSDQAARAGILTHPLLLSRLAYGNASSPIHRGVFLSKSILGRTLKPPPEDVELEFPEVQGKLTTRELVARQTSPAVCQGCHSMINGLGFSLEHFDAVGRYRQTEHSLPIDAGGVYQDRRGEESTFRNSRELVEFLAESSECHAALVEQLFHFMVKQPVRAFGPQRGQELGKHFTQHDLNIRELLQEIAVRSALDMHHLTRKPTPQTAASQ